jgi:hypothetical protein
MESTFTALRMYLYKPKCRDEVGIEGPKWSAEPGLHDRSPHITPQTMHKCPWVVATFPWG